MKIRFIRNLIVLCAAIITVSCTKSTDDNDFDSLSNQEKIQLLDIKIKNEPKNDGLYYKRAEVFYAMGNTKEALYNIQKAVELNKKDVRYYLLQTDIFFSRGETTLAFNSLGDALQVNPKSVEAHLKSAELSLDLKDYKRCMESLNKVIELDKINARAFFMRGWVMKETGDTVKAVRDYRKAIELKSDYEQPFEELGILYAEKGDPLAVDYLKSAIKINPENIHAMYALALFYQDNEAIQQALDLYQQILEIKPDYADAIHNVGWINYQYKQDYNTALDCFTKAIKADSSFYQAWYNRGKTYEKLGKHQEAQSDLTQADNLKHGKEKQN